MYDLVAYEVFDKLEDIAAQSAVKNESDKVRISLAVAFAVLEKSVLKLRN